MFDTADIIITISFVLMMSHCPLVSYCLRRPVSGPGLIIPTGPVKPQPSDSGLPDRLTGNRWKPVEFKSKFKIACVIGLDRYTLCCVPNPGHTANNEALPCALDLAHDKVNFKFYK